MDKQEFKNNFEEVMAESTIVLATAPTIDCTVTVQNDELARRSSINAYACYSIPELERILIPRGKRRELYGSRLGKMMDVMTMGKNIIKVMDFMENANKNDFEIGGYISLDENWHISFVENMDESYKRLSDYVEAIRMGNSMNVNELVLHARTAIENQAYNSSKNSSYNSPIEVLKSFLHIFESKTKTDEFYTPKNDSQRDEMVSKYRKYFLNNSCVIKLPKERNGLDLAGLYHTHPKEDCPPSDVDVSYTMMYLEPHVVISRNKAYIIDIFNKKHFIIA